MENLDSRVLIDADTEINSAEGPIQPPEPLDLTLRPVVETGRVGTDIGMDTDDVVLPVWDIDRESRGPRGWAHSGSVERTDVNRGGGWS